MKLASADPFSAPLVDPGLLTNDFDITALRQGIKNAIAFTTAPVWKDYIIEMTGNLASAPTDAEIDQYIRSNADTIWHLCGTAAMTRPNASWGVVNPDLKVKGVTGLRIVDASVFVRLVQFILLGTRLISL